MIEFQFTLSEELMKFLWNKGISSDSSLTDYKEVIQLGLQMALAKAMAESQ